jgi:hypothetical protein
MISLARLVMQRISPKVSSAPLWQTSARKPS